MESWKNARFQAKSHETEKLEGATYEQDITPAILNGFGDKEIFYHRANLLLFFHFATPIPLLSLSAFSLPPAVARLPEEVPSLFHISWP